MKLKIVITNQYCHPHYGGDRKQVFEFPMEQGAKAEQKFIDLTSKDDGYSHTSICIVEVE